MLRPHVLLDSQNPINQLKKIIRKNNAPSNREEKLKRGPLLLVQVYF